MAQQGGAPDGDDRQRTRLLDRPATLQPVLHKLGARHTGYGRAGCALRDVGSALLKTLEQGLGEAFTADVRLAWAELYGVISRTMLEGALEPAMAG